MGSRERGNFYILRDEMGESMAMTMCVKFHALHLKHPNKSNDNKNTSCWAAPKTENTKPIQDIQNIASSLYKHQSNIDGR